MPLLPAVPEARCSTLTRASVRTLQAAGAWQAVRESGRAAEFDAMQVWDGGGGGSVRYSASEAGLPHLGHVVENRLLAGSLAARLRGEAAGGEGRLMLHTGDSLCELRLAGGGDLPPPALGEEPAGPDWAAARLQRGGWLRARLVVAADGGRSRCRELAGVRSVGWSCLKGTGTIFSSRGDDTAVHYRMYFLQ
jgi:2-polyprenyl-6-methoxyphenol hydroxylase-like FAD-dependent oxidoreductase